jgi:hypothetical protein
LEVIVEGEESNAADVVVVVLMNVHSPAASPFCVGHQPISAGRWLSLRATGNARRFI